MQQFQEKFGKYEKSCWNPVSGGVIINVFEKSSENVMLSREIFIPESDLAKIPDGFFQGDEIILERIFTVRSYMLDPEEKVCLVIYIHQSGTTLLFLRETDISSERKRMLGRHSPLTQKDIDETMRMSKTKEGKNKLVKTIFGFLFGLPNLGQSKFDRVLTINEFL